ncbi:MAG: hypothetical protein IJI45_11185 [Anaerolineaceae bacterium]|nr:hypothetical protein [Anaerolineaceae bacterium]
MVEDGNRQIDEVIVTVVSRRMKHSVDMKVPCNKPIELLEQEIVSLLADEWGDKVNEINPIRLSFNNRIIQNGQTLATVGAWDGSYIYID